MTVASASLSTFPAYSPMLATHALGGAHRAGILQSLAELPFDVCVVDFTSVVAATGSYLKGLLFGPTTPTPGSSRSPAFFASNINSEVRDELNTLCTANSLVTLEILDFSQSQVKNARIIGPLDDSLSRTIRHLVSKGEASASEISALANDRVHPTAWNNRLAELHRRNLVERWKVGKQWIFRFLAEEVVYG